MCRFEELCRTNMAQKLFKFELKKVIIYLCFTPFIDPDLFLDAEILSCFIQIVYSSAGPDIAGPFFLPKKFTKKTIAISVY